MGRKRPQHQIRWPDRAPAPFRRGPTQNPEAAISVPTDEIPLEYTISWNNSQSSTLTLTDGDIETILGTEQVTLVGTVTSGEFTGAAATFVAIFPAPNPLACLSSPGITSQSGTLTVEIIGT